MTDEKNTREENTRTITNDENCERDVSVVADGKFLNDGIVEVADKEEYIDEP